MSSHNCTMTTANTYEREGGQTETKLAGPEAAVQAERGEFEAWAKDGYNLTRFTHEETGEDMGYPSPKTAAAWEAWQAARASAPATERAGHEELVKRARELLALREKATPGHWMVDDDTHVLCSDGTSVLAETDSDATRGETYTPEDAAFIAAAHDMADTIRDLLAALITASAPQAATERAGLVARLRAISDAMWSATGDHASLPSKVKALASDVDGVADALSAPQASNVERVATSAPAVTNAGETTTNASAPQAQEPECNCHLYLDELCPVHDRRKPATPAGWRPINEAPHDKTTVALLHVDGSFRLYGVGYYMPLTGWQGWDAQGMDPTHFCALPPPPKEPQS